MSVYPLTLGDIYVGIPFNLGDIYVGLPLKGLMGQFYRSYDPTNSIIGLKDKGQVNYEGKVKINTSE